MSNKDQYSFLFLDTSEDLLFLSLEYHFFLLLVFFFVFYSLTQYDEH